MKIIYSNKAARDLRRLIKFIAIHNPISANQAYIDLSHAINNLLLFPGLGKKIIYEKKLTPLRELVIQKYVVRYEILDQKIYIIRIWHSKEDR